MSFNYRNGVLPFQAGSSKEVAEVRLYASWDKGLTWTRIAAVSADTKEFKFKLDRDGLVYLAAQVVAHDGRMYPPSQALKADLKLLVNTEIRDEKVFKAGETQVTAFKAEKAR
jgi:hypothetical protein